MNIITITIDSVGKFSVASATNIQQGNHLVDQFKFVFDSSWGTITQVQVHALLPDEVTVTPNTVLTISSVGGTYWTYDVPSWFTQYAGQLNLAISVSYALVGEETPKRFSRIIPLFVDKTVVSEGSFEIDPIVEDSLLTSIADLTARMIVVENNYLKKEGEEEQSVEGIVNFDEITIAEKYFSWNTAEGTFDVEMLNGAVLQLGQEFYFYGKATEAIAEGSPVQFAGAEGGHIKLKNAVPSEINANPEYMIGIATTTFSGNGVFGYVTILGKVKGLNTNSYNEGDILWFDSTSGGLTTTKPSAPKAKIEMGAVLRKHATQGSIIVRVGSAMKLGNLQDVSVNGETNGSVLEKVDGVWQGTTRLNEVEIQADDLQGQIDAIVIGEGILINEATDPTTAVEITRTGNFAWNSVNGSMTFNALNGAITLNSESFVSNATDSYAINTETLNINSDVGNVNATTQLNLVSPDIQLSGNVTVGGDLFVQGTGYETELETLLIKDNELVLRDGAVAGLASGEYAGFTFKLYDGTNDGQLVVGNDGYARVGDLGSLQILATRQDTPTANGVAYFNNTDKRFDTNSTVLINPAAIGNVPLTVNALTGQTADLFKAQLNGSDRFTVGQNGNVYSNGYYLTNNGLINAGGINNSHVNVSSDGVIIYRNVNNSQPALKINSAQGTGNVVNFLKNGSTVGQITQYGQYQGASFGNLSNLNYSFYSPGDTGSIIQRNINDANPALTVNQQQGTGDILRLQYGGVTKSSFNKDGYLWIGTATSSSAFEVYTPLVNRMTRTTTTANDNVLSSMVFKRKTSLDMADGFGVGTAFMVEDNSGVEYVLAGISASRYGADNSGRMIFRTSNAGADDEKGTILPNGNWGIGTSTPTAKLHVAGDLKVDTGGTLLASGSGNGTATVTDLRTYKYIELRAGIDDKTSTKIPSTQLFYSAGGSNGISLTIGYYYGSTPTDYEIIPIRMIPANSGYTSIEIMTDITSYDMGWEIYGWNY